LLGGEPKGWIKHKQFRLFYIIMGEYDSYIAENTYYTAVNTARMLEEQKQTNQELNRLRNQMANANAMQQQMLQNQIRDIEERETQKFYKLRSFKLSQLVTSIDNLTDINQKAFTFYNFQDVIIQNATDAQNNLNEISDKEYCNSIMTKVRDINKQIGNIDELAIGDELKKFINGVAEYDTLCNELESTKTSLNNRPSPPIEPKSKTISYPNREKVGYLCMFLSVISILNALNSKHDQMEVWFIDLLLLAIGFGLRFSSPETQTPTDAEINKYNDAIVQYNTTIENWKAKISELESQIANCDYMKALKFFFTDHPEWKAEIDNCYKQLSY